MDSSVPIVQVPQRLDDSAVDIMFTTNICIMYYCTILNKEIAPNRVALSTIAADFAPNLLSATGERVLGLTFSQSLSHKYPAVSMRKSWKYDAFILLRGRP